MSVRSLWRTAAVAGVVVALAGCGSGGLSESFTAVGGPRTLRLVARSGDRGGALARSNSSTAIVVGTLTLKGSPHPRGIDMNRIVGWGPSVPDEGVDFCIVGGTPGRRLLEEQRRSPDRVFRAPSLRGRDPARECVFETTALDVPDGTYTVLVRVDAPSHPATTSIYASGIEWTDGHDAGDDTTSHTIRRPDHRNFATVRITAR